MILFVFSLRDVKSDTFMPPMFTPSIGHLMRDLQDAVNDPKGTELLSRHPSDFHLMKLGTFDNVKGVFTLLPLPDFVLDCGSLAVGQEGSGATGAPVAPVSITRGNGSAVSHSS